MKVTSASEGLTMIDYLTVHGCFSHNIFSSFLQIFQACKKWRDIGQVGGDLIGQR